MFICLALSIVPLPALAQGVPPGPEQYAVPRTPLWIGFGAGVNFLQFSTDGNLRCLSDPTCPSYNGSGVVAPSFGASLDWRLSDGFGLLLRTNYNLAKVSLSADDDRARVLDASGNIVPLVRRHSLQISAPYISVDLLANIIGGKFRVFGGGEVGLLLSPMWESSSAILSPGNVTFGNNRRDTMFLPQSAIFDVATFQPKITVGIGYDFYLSSKLLVTPELHGALPLTAIVETGNLRMATVGLSTSLRFGCGLVKIEEKLYHRLFDTITIENPAIAGNRFSFGKNIVQLDVVETDTKRIITETTMRRDTLILGMKKKVEPPKPIDPVASFEVRAMGTVSPKSPLKEFVVRGRYATEAFPLLPMIFFDKNSSSPAARYHLLASSDGFSEDNLLPSVLEQHRDILNIVGQRMRDNPKTAIRLRGTADGTTENADCQLAEARARSIQDYLVSTWGVSEERIKITRSRRKCEPETPTMSAVEAGYAENRRVEIESDDDETLLAPVLRKKYIELTGIEPQRIEIDPSGSTAGKFQSWSATVRYRQMQAGAESGTGRPTAKQFTVTDDIAQAMHSGAEAVTVDVLLSITDADGRTAKQETEIPVRRDTLRQEIDRLSLMHFQVLKDKLNRTAKAAVKRFVTGLNDEATVSVVGYTDNLGDPSLNAKLSSGRAEEVTNYIKHLKPSVNIIRSEGVAATKFPPGILSHDLPESRILSRTVQIEIIRNQ
ncbi:hypothetical protein MASR2M18_13200 [Ignavibacteria bacterium]